MVMCAVSYSRKLENKLLGLGVKDSKKLTKKKREEIFNNLIKNDIKYKVYKIPVKEIEKKNLNDLELKYHSKLIKYTESKKIYIDAPVNPRGIKKYKARLMKIISSNKHIVLKNKAEDLFPSVACASIIAKHIRDTIVKGYERKYGRIGSGYPSDEKTIKFLSKYENRDSLPGIVRKKWKTLDRIGFGYDNI